MIVIAIARAFFLGGALSVLAVLPWATANAQVPALASVPDVLHEALRSTLLRERSALASRLERLQSQAKIHNMQCWRVRAGTRQAAACRARKRELTREGAKYSAAATAFNERVAHAIAQTLKSDAEGLRRPTISMRPVPPPLPPPPGSPGLFDEWHKWRVRVGLWLNDPMHRARWLKIGVPPAPRSPNPVGEWRVRVDAWLNDPMHREWLADAMTVASLTYSMAEGTISAARPIARSTVSTARSMVRGAIDRYSVFPRQFGQLEGYTSSELEFMQDVNRALREMSDELTYYKLPTHIRSPSQPKVPSWATAEPPYLQAAPGSHVYTFMDAASVRIKRTPAMDEALKSILAPENRIW